MLLESLTFIETNFNAFLKQIGMAEPYHLVLGNIAFHDDSNASTGANDTNNNLIISLINIEEERTLKNEPSYKKNGIDIVRQNQPVFLNLYVLFSATINDYREALKYLSLVIAFFQQKPVFTKAENLPENIEKLSFEIFDLSFEQTYNLWGVLGSKLVPNILYKVRLVTIQAAPETLTGIVEEIIITDQSI